MAGAENKLLSFCMLTACEKKLESLASQEPLIAFPRIKLTTALSAFYLSS